MTLNVIVLILQAVNLSFRGHAKGNHYWRHGWILSLVSVVLLAISGWLGSTLVYHFKMGVSTKRKGYLVLMSILFSCTYTCLHSVCLFQDENPSIFHLPGLWHPLRLSFSPSCLALNLLKTVSSHS
jgi:uncharacterized membrane protein YfcA